MANTQLGFSRCDLSDHTSLATLRAGRTRLQNDASLPRRSNGVCLDRPGLDSKTKRIRGRASLYELVGVVLALDERSSLEERDRRRLDREIRTSAGVPNRRSIGLLRTWLQVAPTDSLRARIKSLRVSLVRVSWLLVAAGFCFGWATASALLSIKIHEGRINIVVAVALLVVVPFCLFIAGLLGWLWSLRPSGTGATRSLTELLRSIGFGRLALRFLPPSVRQDVEVVIGRFTAHGRLYGRVERGQLLLWSQAVGTAFGVGALVATLAFVVFTDLAFGWSTTLDVSASAVHRWTRVLAAPWASIWPAANPSLELVEATRFFHVALEDRIHAVDPIVYGGWWPFLVMSILSCAVLPRALMMGAVSFWVARETSYAIGLTPGVDRLLDRLTTPIVETQALSEEGEIGRPSNELAPEVEMAGWLAAHAGAEPKVVRWAELSSEESLRAAIGIEALRFFDAGGRCSLEDDATVARELAGGTVGIIVCVRGFEPPVLDVLDFLRAIRDQVGLEQPLLVVLFGANGGDVRAWRRKLIGLGDPRLVVASARIADV